MKKVFASLLFLFASSAFAFNLYGGTVNAASVGATQVATQGGSGAVFAGIAGTQSNSQAGQGGIAGGSVSPSGVVVGQGGASGTSGGSTSGALGAAAAGSVYGGQAGNVSGATGAFGTIGFSF